MLRTGSILKHADNLFSGKTTEQVNLREIRDNFLANYEKTVLNPKKSMRIQKYLGQLGLHKDEEFLSKLKGSFSWLIVNKVGNYFISSIFNLLEDQSKIELVQIIRAKSRSILLSQNASKAIQKMLETKQSEFVEKAFVNLLIDKITVIITGKYAWRLLTKAFESFSKLNIFALLSAVAESAGVLATSLYGAGVVHSVKELHPTNPATKAIYSNLADNYRKLILNEAGNYLLNMLVNEKLIEDKISFIIKDLSSDSKFLAKCCKSKYSSYLVEMLVSIDFGADRELLKSLEKIDQKQNLMKNRYGKYVIKVRNQLWKEQKASTEVNSDETTKKGSSEESKGKNMEDSPIEQEMDIMTELDKFLLESSYFE